jgi:single-strand selective monofunctional uracil DNA glycosylase
VFLGPTGRNVTPSELPKTGLYRDMITACDEHLRRVVKALGARVVVGIGNYSFDRCRIALTNTATIVKVPHPSPRNPSAAVSWLSDATKIIHDADTLAHQVQ